MKIAICDDEKKFLDMLKGMISSCYSDVDSLSINEYGSGEELLQEFKPGKFDVIILDIEMKALTGLDVAKIVRETDKAVIIAFLTSHQEFAIEGYEVSAFRYMLKSQPESMFRRQLQSIYDEYHQTHITYPVQVSGGVLNLTINDIMYFEVFGRTIVLHTKSGKHQYNGRLAEIEKDERLVCFIKPHKSYYVNMANIQKLEAANIIMKNGDNIPLSRNFRQTVTDKYISFLTKKS